jgi:hypothetical protein
MQNRQVETVVAALVEYQLSGLGGPVDVGARATEHAPDEVVGCLLVCLNSMFSSGTSEAESERRVSNVDIR